MSKVEELIQKIARNRLVYIEKPLLWYLEFISGGFHIIKQNESQQLGIMICGNIKKIPSNRENGGWIR
jgi:hypothetical protein